MNDFKEFQAVSLDKLSEISSSFNQKFAQFQDQIDLLQAQNDLEQKKQQIEFQQQFAAQRLRFMNDLKHETEVILKSFRAVLQVQAEQLERFGVGKAEMEDDH